jgi:Pentapeptide repeats (8 copies)
MGLGCNLMFAALGFLPCVRIHKTAGLPHPYTIRGGAMRTSENSVTHELATSENSYSRHLGEYSCPRQYSEGHERAWEVHQIVADEGSQQRKPDVRTAVADAKALARMLAMEAESILGRRAAQVLGVIVLFAVVVGVLLALLNWYIAPTDAEQKQALVVTLAQILGGTALLSGLYFTWRTLQVNREGQITERFTRAIDQLGATNDDNSKNLELRLGGIYALERIARESKEDHWPIMEVLTAYVRQHAPWGLEEAQQFEEDAAPAPAADIQAIMTVIGRRTRSFGRGEPERLDLHQTNLSRVDLRGADLTGAILWHANLSEAHLSEADLSGADLTRADLTGALLMEAHLSEADLSSANLFSADLFEAHLSEADLFEANFLAVDLSGADLSGSLHLTQKQLTETAGDEDTKLPPDLKPPAHWDVKTDEQIEGD